MKKIKYILFGFILFGCIAATSNNIPDGCLRLNKGRIEWYSAERGWVCSVQLITDKVYNCGMKIGHDFRYVRVEHSSEYTRAYEKVVIYKCNKCKYVISKYLDEITQKEKEALQLLGIIE